MSSRLRRFVLWAICLTVGLIHSSPVWATRPGFNGAIAYVQSKAIWVDGQQMSHPPEGAIDSSPAWSPDGSKLAFIRSSFRIYMMNADGSNLRILTDSAPPNEPGPHGYLSSLAWTSNGLDVMFLASPNSSSGPFTRWRVMVSLPNIVNGGGAHAANEPLRDVLKEEVVYACPTNTPKICIESGGVRVLDLTNELQEEVVSGTLASVSSPQWQTTKIAGRPRVLFAATVYPDGSFPARRELYSINPHYRYNPSTGIGTYEYDTERVTVSALFRCGIDENGPIVPGALTPLTEYGTPVPSPDGEFFVAERLTRTGNPDCGGSRNLFRFTKDGAEAGQVGSDASQPAWQPKLAQLAVYVETMFNDPLEGAEVDIRRDDGTAVPGLTTDRAPGGAYLYSGLLPGDYRVRVTLKAEAFEIHHEFPSSEPVWAEKKLSLKGDPEAMKFRFVFDDTGLVQSSLGSGGPNDRLGDMSLIFRNLHQFVEWLKVNLIADTGDRLPFYTFATRNPEGNPVTSGAAFYRTDVRAVWLGTSTSSLTERVDSDKPGSAQAPENVEWHEFTHHIFSRSCSGEINHGGYGNSSTCDSLKEGIPSFLAAWANAGQDSLYAGFGDLEWHTKAYGFRITGSLPPYSAANPGLFSDEDLAVAALLWDIVDTAVDSEYTNVRSDVISPGTQLHLPVVYTDTVSIPLQTLWSILQGSGARTVYELRSALDGLPVFSELTIDLDNDGTMDASAGDQLFLMHGFFPIQHDQNVSGQPSHRYHYDVREPDILGNPPLFDPNQSIGLSSHEAIFTSGFIGFRQIPRFNVPETPNANLHVELRDASGTPLQDTEIEFTIAYPGSTQTLTQRIGDGAGTRVPFGLPTYFDYIPSGPTLPDCDPENDLHVDVVARASVNGYPAASTVAFDNCEYQQAILAAASNSALALEFEFPEDSDSPQATRDFSNFGGTLASHRPNLVIEGIWVVKLTCDDPVVGDFASGCLPIEYRVDDGSWLRYDDEFDVREPGLHLLEVRAKDRAGNVASIDSVELGVVAQFDPVPPVTTITAVASVPPVDGYTAGVWQVSFDCEDHNQTPQAIPSGCVTTEYSVDGAPFTAYGGAFQVAGPGEHIVQYRSIDLMNNAEAVRSSTLRVAGPDTTPPYTNVDIVFDGGAGVFGDAVMSSSITFSFASCSDGGPQDQVQSGCATSEFAVDNDDFGPFGAPVIVTEPGLHRFRWRSADAAGNAEDLRSLALTLVAPADQDEDTVPDWYDNCLQVPNTDQRNGEGDQFGNACDPDFNGNGRVDSQDASFLKSRLGSSASSYPYLDLSGDDFVDSQDLVIIKAMFGNPPGPAGVAVSGGGN